MARHARQTNGFSMAHCGMRSINREKWETGGILAQPDNPLAQYTMTPKKQAMAPSIHVLHSERLLNNESQIAPGIPVKAEDFMEVGLWTGCMQYIVVALPG